MTYKSLKTRERVTTAVTKSNHERRTKFNYTLMTPELAYILGAYLGDGSICHNNPRKGHKVGGYTLSLSAVDIDFINEFKSNIKVILNKEYNIKRRKKNIPTQKDIYSYRVGCGDLCKWILKVTGYKKCMIPKDIMSSNNNCKQQFLIGLIDSEGTIQINYHKNKLSSTSILFGVTKSWCYNIKHLFNELNVKTGKMRKYQPEGKKLFLRFNINAYDFHEAGFYLNIARKQKRLDKYINSRNHKNRAWSSKEILFLKENYSNTSTLKLADIMNKTVESIRSKAHHLKIKKSKKILTLIRRKAQKQSIISKRNNN